MNYQQQQIQNRQQPTQPLYQQSLPPLPQPNTTSAPPPTVRPVQTRQRKSSGFSFRSNSSSKSHKRGASGSLAETSAEKSKTKMSVNTKANPNAALREAQPIALALEKSTLSGLQNIRCNDIFGNLISMFTPSFDKTNGSSGSGQKQSHTVEDGAAA
jgi:hypothetical protein